MSKIKVITANNWYYSGTLLKDEPEYIVLLDTKTGHEVRLRKEFIIVQEVI